MDSVPGNEIPEIKRNSLNYDYSLRFINIVIQQFRHKSNEKEDFVILTSLFEIPNTILP